MGLSNLKSSFLSFLYGYDVNEDENERKKRTFYQDMGKTEPPYYKIMNDATDPVLKDINRWYGIVDKMSIENAIQHEKILRSLALAGTVLTIAFLLYDEAELHFLIMACLILILYLFGINIIAKRWENHRKYLEYRVFAETLRVHFFLKAAQIKEPVTNLMPWYVKEGIPWIKDIISTLPKDEVAKKQPIIDYWIRNQKEYHQRALGNAEKEKKTFDRDTWILIAVAIAVYIITLIFEGWMYFNSPHLDANFWRAIIKIAIGTASAGALFAGSYFGKKSLSEKIDDHSRMILLYDQVEEKITQSESGETDEDILFLAREFLIENSIWYAYQSQNGPEIVM